MSLIKRRFISRLWVALIEQQENDVFKVLSTNWLDAVNVSLFKFKPGYQLYSGVLDHGCRSESIQMQVCRDRIH